MKAWYRSALLATVPIIGIAIGLSGCKPSQSPGDVCSAASTYDGLNKVIASASGPSGGADLQAKLKRFLQYTLTTVDAVDKDTGKVTCNSVMRFSGSPEGVHAIEGVFGLRKMLQAAGQSDDPDNTNMPLTINDQAPDHVSFQIHYSVQPTADKTDNVIKLGAAESIAEVVGLGIAAADKATATPTAPPPPPSNGADPENTTEGIATASDGNPSSTGNQDDDDSLPNQIRIDPSQYGNIDAGIDKDNYQTAMAKLSQSGWHEIKPFPHGDCSEVHSAGWDCAYYYARGSQFLVVTIENGDVPDDVNNLRADVTTVSAVSQLPTKPIY